MDLIVERFGNTTELVDEFEKCDEDGTKRYDRLVILEAYRDKFCYGHPKFGFIIKREEETNEKTFAISLMKYNGIFNSIISKYWDKRDELGKEGCIDIMLPEDESIHLKAEGSIDRTGFHKLYGYNGEIVSQKNYGDCSFFYKIVGFRISPRN